MIPKGSYLCKTIIYVKQLLESFIIVRISENVLKMQLTLLTSQSDNINLCQSLTANIINFQRNCTLHA